ncbi:MFS transporter [Streptomyces sp. NPDC006430]|uniref:MFS transporter n=1 Tax=Streptomyces sp. NPDC006430 TaxID=3154299 RepID=UPI0033B1074F
MSTTGRAALAFVNRSLGVQEGIPRALALGSVTTALGSGVFAAGSAVFFTGYVGCSATQVGLGLSAAALVVFALQVPLGVLVDALGSWTCWLASVGVLALLYTCYPLVDGFGWFLVVIVLSALGSATGGLSRGRYLGDVLGTEARVRASARLRVNANIGMSLGMLLAAAALAVGTREAYIALPVLNAVSYVVDLVLIGCFLRRTEPAPRGPAKLGGAAVQDGPFLLLTVINGVMMVNDTILSVVMPLWVLRRTDAPAATVAAVVLLNTVLSVFCQVRASRGAEHVPGAARAQRRAGYAIAASCVVFGATQATSGAVTLLLLALATVALTAGELLEAAAAWGISYRLSPDDRRGEYLALFGLGPQFMNIIGPVALTGLTLAYGWLAWLGIGAVVLFAGAAASPAAAWAVRRADAPRTRSEDLV